MTEAGKPKYFTLMEQLKAIFCPEIFGPDRSFLQKMSFLPNIR